MVRITQAVVIALAGTSMALHVTFERFSQPGCPASNWIGKNTDLRDGKCKTFDKHEPPFESFRVTPRIETDDVTHKLCKATAYELPNCKGKGYSMDDLRDSQRECGHPNFNARSVGISCDARPQQVDVHPPTKTSTQVVAVTTVPHPHWQTSKTQILVVDHPASSETIHTTKTLTYVPKPSVDCTTHKGRNGK